MDTNVISYLDLTSDLSYQGERLLPRDPQWAAPALWRSELRNVLALYMRRKMLCLEAAQQTMDAAMRLKRDREYEVASSRVLALAAASSCSAYDREYVAVAQDLGVPLVTVAKRILGQFPGSAVPLELYAGS